MPFIQLVIILVVFAQVESKKDSYYLVGFIKGSINLEEPVNVAVTIIKLEKEVKIGFNSGFALEVLQEVNDIDLTTFADIKVASLAIIQGREEEYHLNIIFQHRISIMVKSSLA